MPNGAILLVMCVLCGAVAATDELVDEVEARLFEHGALPAEDLQAFIAEELAGHGLSVIHIAALPTPFQLWDVPTEGLAIARHLELAWRARQADGGTGRLRDSVWSTAIFDTSEGLVVSLEAHKAGVHQPVFTFAWTVAGDLEDADDILEDFAAVAAEVGARVLPPGAPAPGRGWQALN